MNRIDRDRGDTEKSGMESGQERGSGRKITEFAFKILPKGVFPTYPALCEHTHKSTQHTHSMELYRMVSNLF